MDMSGDQNLQLMLHEQVSKLWLLSLLLRRPSFAQSA
jgi:hypothetical protein